MAEQHRATDKQWRDVKALADDIVTYSCIHELLCRIEALESAATAKSNHPAKPDSSLVERVAAAIHPNVCADPNLYLHEARAAIREVADWMRENPDVHFPPALVFALEQEARL